MQPELKAEPLPSIRALAQITRASTRTVRQAIKELIAEGIIESRSRQGLYPAGATPPALVKPLPTTRARWQDTEYQIAQDLRKGIYPRERPLPPLKELCRRYACSRTPLDRALAILVQTGSLVRTRRQYFQVGAVPSTPRQHRNSIRLLAFARKGVIPLETSREIDFFRAVEEETQQAGLDLIVVGYDDYATFPRFYWEGKPLATLPPPPPNLLGTLLAPWHMRSSAECLEHLLHEGLPVSVWSESGGEIPVPQTLRRRPLRYFDIGYGEGPGECMARALAAKGHRRIAFISPFHASTWSQGRWHGLQSCGRNLGLEILSFVDENTKDPWTIRDRVDSDGGWKIRRAQWLDQEELRLGYNRSHLEEVLSEARRDEWLMPLCAPLFKNAWDSDCSAWVLVNDLVAQLAGEFLQGKPTPTPVRIGFDNTTAALQNRFSSFEFDTRSLVRAMLGFVLTPRNPLFASGEVIRPEGFVVWR